MAKVPTIRPRVEPQKNEHINHVKLNVWRSMNSGHFLLKNQHLKVLLNGGAICNEGIKVLRFNKITTFKRTTTKLNVFLNINASLLQLPNESGAFRRRQIVVFFWNDFLSHILEQSVSECWRNYQKRKTKGIIAQMMLITKTAPTDKQQQNGKRTMANITVHDGIYCVCGFTSTRFH